jgi:uncharacterized membrane protein YtjA (UPF0391 family)
LQQLESRGGLPTSDEVNSRLQSNLARRILASLQSSGGIMLHYAVVFFVIALIAALFGFGGIAAGAASIAKILFVIFLIGAVVSLLIGTTRRV